MAANPIQQVLQMIMERYPERGEARSQIEPGSGTPLSMGKIPLMSDDYMDIREILIELENMRSKELGKEKGGEDETFTPPKRAPWRDEYMEPGEPEPIAQLTPGLLTRLVEAGIGPQQYMKMASLTPSPGYTKQDGILPDKVLGDTDEDVETNIPSAARSMIPPPDWDLPRYPGGLSPELMRAISDQYERIPENNPLNNPVFDEYLEEDTEEPIG